MLSQNIGLQANILSTRTFTIFVVMALLTTFATTPIVSVLYPPWYQVKIAAWRRGEIDWDTGAPITSPTTSSDGAKDETPSIERVNRLLVYLRLDNMPSLLRLLAMFGNTSTEITPAASDTGNDEIQDVSTSATSTPKEKPVWAHGIRLLQLTDRDSSVMTVAQVDDYSRHDPVVNTFRTVGQLHNLSASGEVAIMPETRFAEALVAKSSKMASDLLLVPWTETGDMVDSQILSSTTVNDKIGSSYGSFVKSVFESHDRNVAVFFSRSDPAAEGKAKSNERGKLMRAYSFGTLKDDIQVAPVSNKPYHIFLVYFGDQDDKLALHLVLQLCEKSKATATILHARSSASTSSSAADSALEHAASQLSASVASRVKFDTATGASTVEELLQYATTETQSEQSGPKIGPQLVVMGRRVAAQMDEGKLTDRPREDLRTCLGKLAGAFVAGGVKADLLVVQAKTVAEA